MEATTTRASTVIRSMPTSEMRTQASMTMPLSSTRSSTSIRLVPPGALSTAIWSASSLPKLVRNFGARRRRVRVHASARYLIRGETAPRGGGGERKSSGRRLAPALSRAAFTRVRARPGALARDAHFVLFVGGRKLSDLALKGGDALAQLDVLRLGGRGARRQVRVVAPPVQAYLLGLVDGADEQANL